MRIILLSLAGVLLAACSADHIEPADRGEAAYTEGMASTAHPVATQAGLDILADGGNALLVIARAVKTAAESRCPEKQTPQTRLIGSWGDANRDQQPIRTCR